MALIEQQLATELVDLREQEALGTQYTPIGDHIAALQRHLECEWGWRASIVDTDTDGGGLA